MRTEDSYVGAVLACKVTQTSLVAQSRLAVVWFVFGVLLSGMSLSGAYLHARRIAVLRHPVRPLARRTAVWATSRILLLTAALAVLNLKSYALSTPFSTSAIAIAPACFVAFWTLGTLAIVATFIRQLHGGPDVALKA